MSMLRPMLKLSVPAFAEALAPVLRPRAARLDLVHLARHSLGDKSREMELLGHFDQQAGLAGPRLRAAADADSARAIARMLGASARTAGAFAVAAACDAYAGTLADGLSGRDQQQALEILEEEIGIVRDAISDLLTR